VSNGNAFVAAYNTGTLSASAAVHASSLNASSLNLSTDSTFVRAFSNGWVTASNVVRAATISATEALSAPGLAVQGALVSERFVGQYTTNSLLLNFWEQSVHNVEIFSSASNNVRFNYRIESDLAPGLRLQSTVTNARFLENGARDTQLNNSGTVSGASIGVTTNTELVFSTTNQLNSAVTRGIRMAHVNRDNVNNTTNTVLISPNGVGSFSVRV
jgi:hypothetical protein